jgi:amidohydrolase
MDPKLLNDLITLRRDLHRHPETRFNEHRTAALLAGHLEELGFTVTRGVAGTGVIGHLDSGRPGPHVVLRADMDALHTADTKTVDYASENAGAAHVCGHDVHCAVVLGAATLVMSGSSLPAGGRLTVLFQPAEEIPFGEASGAAAILNAGQLRASQPDAVLGLHCWPQLPSGSVGVDAETAMASKLAFKISVHGRGAHAATPQLGSDALLGASQIVIALHTLVSRERDPSERVALNVGTINAGTSQSIVASKAEFTGTVRTVNEAVSARFKSSIERVTHGVAAAYGLTADVDWKNQMPAVHNDARLVAIARSRLPQVPAVDDVVLIDEPPMTTDDFALYAAEWPGLYLKLGVAAPGAESWPSLHDGGFDVDESCIETGSLSLAALADAVLSGDLDGVSVEPPSTFIHLAEVGEQQ